MSFKIKHLLYLLPLFLLSACATGYQREGVFLNGYSDYKAASNQFVVTFRANEFTPQEKVLKYVMKRAAEITIQNGYHYFLIIDEMNHQIKKGKSFSYPSCRISIQCFHEAPSHGVFIDAREFLSSSQK